jgi:hypothetical protein
VGGEGNGTDLEEEENGKEDANHAADKNKHCRRAHLLTHKYGQKKNQHQCDNTGASHLRERLL